MSGALHSGLLALLLGVAAAAPAETQEHDRSSLGPEEILQAGNAAYLVQDWTEAVSHFQAFLEAFGAAPAAAEVLDRIRALLALAHIHLGHYDLAGPLVDDCLDSPRLDPPFRDELSFWRGIILLQSEAFDDSRAAFLTYFQTGDFNSLRRVETILLYGTTFVLENEHAKAVAFFEQQSQRLWELNRETALRAQILRLHSLVELGRIDKAREVVELLQPLLGEVTQIVSLHGLTAELGGRFLEAGDHYSAIFCLQRVWSTNRLVKHQEERIKRLRDEVETLQQRPDSAPLLFQKRSVLTRIEREHRTFAANKDFDLAVRMRLGFAWLGLERYREAALVLEDALALPGDPKQLAQAGLVAIQGWTELKRHERVISAADAWLSRFGKIADEDSTARVRFLLAQAHYDGVQFSRAAGLFAEAAREHPKHEIAAQAMFMAGMSYMMADNYDGALAVFAAVKQQFVAQPIREDADYWQGMALYFKQDHAQCRKHMLAHLQSYGDNARYAAAANFRKAYCLFALAQYEDALSELRGFCRAYPEGRDFAEAQILIGDTLCSLGDIDAGLENYRVVPAASAVWFEEAQFRMGKVLKLRKDWEGLRAHFRRFVLDKPDSRRMAEAIYWQGLASLAQNHLDEARSLYWLAVRTHGDTASHFGVEEILLALPHLYKGPQARVDLLREIQRVRVEAQKDDRATLACRLHWMEGQMQAADKPRLAQADFMMAASLLDVERQNPRVIADCADALRSAGSKARAKKLYAELIKWHPRAFEVERALAGLGFLAADAGDWQEALGYFDRHEKRSFNADLKAGVFMRKAQIFGEHARTAEAIGIYKELLEDKLASGRSKAEALMAWAWIWEGQGEVLKATALYERVYLSYGRHRDLAAEAYLARGLALEKLGKRREAVQVYAELNKTEMLKGYAAWREASARLRSLGGHLDALQGKEEQP